MTRDQLSQLTSKNSYMTNSQFVAWWFQKDIMFANKRAMDYEKLHEHIFDIKTQSELENKELITLYGMALNDMNKRTSQMIKLATDNEKIKVVKDITKQFADQEKEAQMQVNGQSHTINVLQILLSESMKHTLDDEYAKKYGGSNSYRPPEDMTYEVLAIDANADD